FWTDLEHAEPGANVFTQRIAPAVDPANPAGHWIIQWHRSSHYGHSDENLNFQVKLFDDGTLEMHYAGLLAESLSSAAGGEATVWFEDPTGTHAQVIGVNQPVLQPNSAYRFTPL
ncbi:MAG: hypothetical protein ACT4TC_09860, partial [Myxococcaceae bacterium]